jgi:PilZ domain-containing protein
MAFETFARKHAKALLDELSDRLLQDLSKAAREEAEAASAKARQEAEHAGASALTAARADHEGKLAAARADHERKLAALRADSESKLAAAEAMNAGLLESVEAANAEAQTAKAAAHAGTEQARQRTKELESRIEQLQQERKEILRSRDEAATRHQAELKRAKELGQRLEAEAQRARVVGENLEAETQRGADLAGRLESELRRGSDLSGRLESEMRRGTELAERLKAETRRSAESDKALEAVRHDREAMIERVGTALQCIDRASSPSEILETLLDPLARDFAITAVFLVGASHIRGWQARGLDAGNDITRLILPLDGESPLARAVAERKQVLIAPSVGSRVTGIWGTPIARAVAVPVMASGVVVAVAYAEDAGAPHTVSFPGPGCQIVQILVEHAALRLTARRQAASPGAQPADAGRPDHAVDKPVYLQARQARRVKKQEGLDLTVDGAESSLVDVSSSGAQILSPVAMRPNRVLRLMLTAGERALACKGRVMWARFEQGRGSAAAHYRVGVKFTDVDQKTVEAFLAGLGAVRAAR